MRHADVVLVLQTPMGGDEVQAAKAGVMEIADIYVVNKGDLPGADQAVRHIEEMTGLDQTLHPQQGWRRPVVKVQSLTGEGIAALDAFIRQRFANLAANPQAERNRYKARIRHRVAELVRESVDRRLLATDDPAMDAWLEQVAARQSDPYALAMKLVKD
jgi:LAO/AO transport system kinase